MLVRSGSGLGLPLTQASRPAIPGGNGRLNNPLPGFVWTGKDEARRWMLATGNTLDTSPAKLLRVTADPKLVDGVLHFGSLDGRLYAVKAS
jgi:hypothetical protein